MAQIIPSPAVRSYTHPSWLRMIGLASVFLAVGSGTGLLFKVMQKILLQKIRSWIRRILLEDNVQSSKACDEGVAMAAVIAVKAASSAAAEVASLSQVIIKMQAEGKQRANDVIKALQNQTQNLLIVMVMMKGIKESKQLLAAKGNLSEKGYNLQDTSYEPFQSAKKAPFSNINPAFASNTRDNLVETIQSSKKPASFLEVMAMLQRGETPPGIKEINDKPPIPNQLPSVSRLQPKPKPWEKDRINSDTKIMNYSTYRSAASAESQDRSSQAGNTYSLNGFHGNHGDSYMTCRSDASAESQDRSAWTVSTYSLNGFHGKHGNTYTRNTNLFTSPNRFAHAAGDPPSLLESTGTPSSGNLEDVSPLVFGSE